jgi:hypothetical protein
MPRIRVRIAASTILVACAAAAVTLVLVGGGESDSAAVAASPSSLSATALRAIPTYSTALDRSQTAQERNVESQTPAADTRLVTSDATDSVYVGRIDDQGVLCLSIQQQATQRLTTTCGGAAALAAGQLHLVRGGDDGTVAVGLAPQGSASVTVNANGKALKANVDGGVFLTRPDAAPNSFEFTDPSGKEIAKQSVPAAVAR